MKNFFKRIWTSAWQHPKTTLIGISGAAVQVLGVAAEAGLHVGHYGPAQFLKLASALSMLFLGAYAHDPQPAAAPVPDASTSKAGN